MSGLLVLNTGSSSLKFGLYRAASDPDLLVHGQVEGIGREAKLIVKAEGTRSSTDILASTPAEALDEVMNALEPHMQGMEIAGVGHRVVHGGPHFAAPVVITQQVRSELEAFTPLAPLHQPHNLAGVTAAQNAFPQAIQIACFDTAFHRGHRWVKDTFALPRSFYDEGIRRYGFHGLSYDYITGVIENEYPELYEGRIIIAHLGNGASMCAVDHGKSVGSTMGFSALDGLPMGTRCGHIDPGAVLYMIEQKGMTPAEVLELLYKRSGLLGLSGITSDMRDLLASDRPEAAQAIEYYVFRARREIGALTAVLGGLDALVFCGGIGENADPIRRQIVEGMEYFGLEISDDDPAPSGKLGPYDIGSGTARIMVIPTDEERVIARAVQSALEEGNVASA